MPQIDRRYRDIVAHYEDFLARYGDNHPGGQPMSCVIVFGLRDFASLAHFYLTHDSEHEVVAFTVTEAYMPSDPRFEGKPVVPFEDLERHYPPQENHFFAPMSPHGMNRIREGIYRQGKERGYRFISDVSSRATFEPYCFLGVNATFRDGLRLGEGTLVAMGACVGRDTEPWSVYQGNPARKREVSSSDVEL
jgi:hypothetical protein